MLRCKTKRQAAVSCSAIGCGSPAALRPVTVGLHEKPIYFSTRVLPPAGALSRPQGDAGRHSHGSNPDIDLAREPNMNAILERIDRKPPPARARAAPPRSLGGKPVIRPARTVHTSNEALVTWAPLLRAAVILIAVSLLLFALGQGMADLVDRVRLLLMPRI
jgi:hypothetical protein